MWKHGLIFVLCMLIVYPVTATRESRSGMGFIGGALKSLVSSATSALSKSSSLVKQTEESQGQSIPDIEPRIMKDKQISHDEVIDQYKPEYIVGDEDNPHTHDWGCCRICEDEAIVTEVKVNLKIMTIQSQCCPLCPFAPKSKDFDVMSYYRYVLHQSALRNLPSKNYERELRAILDNDEQAEFIEKQSEISKDSSVSNTADNEDPDADELPPPLDLDRTFPIPKYFRATNLPCCNICSQSKEDSTCCSYCKRDAKNLRSLSLAKDMQSRSVGIAPPI